MNQKEWYMKILNWAETDSRLNLKYMDMVVLAEHLANEERWLTQRALDAATPAAKCTTERLCPVHNVWHAAPPRK